MPDDIVTSTLQRAAAESPPRAAPHGGGLGRVLLAVLLAFAVGFGIASWIGWQNGADWTRLLPGHSGHPRGFATGTWRSSSDTPAGSATNPAIGPALGSVESRVAALEARIDMLDRAASAAASNAGRAEALLIAFATRRAIERGAPLGYLEDQLKLRFGDALPNAVAAVISGARNPVTLDQLSLGLNDLAVQVASGTAGETGWEKMRREVSGLFVIHNEHPAATPADSAQRLALARTLLREGRTGDAINAIRALGSFPHAAEWIALAQRYQDLQRALDLLETTALLEPRELNDGAGHKVVQPSPLAAGTTASQ